MACIRDALESLFNEGEIRGVRGGREVDVRTTHRGVQRGKAPMRFFVYPQDWGLGG
jgi:hypothetical protein